MPSSLWSGCRIRRCERWRRPRPQRRASGLIATGMAAWREGKNLGIIFGKEGDALVAHYYLRLSFEIDPTTHRPCRPRLCLSELSDTPGSRHAGAVKAGHQRIQVQPHHTVFTRDFIRCAAYSVQLIKLVQAYRGITRYSRDSRDKVSNDNLFMSH